jgi:Bacteriophage T4-like portal protein (Gp20)
LAKLFGYEFSLARTSTENARKIAASRKPVADPKSFVPPENQDGAINVQYGAGGGYFGYYLDLDGTIVDDFQLINRYREMQTVAEVDEAIDQIINEMIVQDAGRFPVSLNLDNCIDIADETKARISAEFDGVLKLMKFHKDPYSVVRQWYVDGRLFYHTLVSEKAPEEGIKELRIIDPRCIRRVRELERKRHEETQFDIVEEVREYYVYNPMGFVSPTSTGGSSIPTAALLNYNGVKVTVDSVAFCPSGIYDSSKRTVLSWLHKAIKPLNMMRMMEDSCVIFRVVRAPERRVFYIDVGNLPKGKAEQYLYDIMQRFRNKLTYDTATGEVRDDRKFQSILEDFWLPRREGGKGTEITTLPAGQNLSEMEDVDYFRRKLYRALNLPPARIDPGQGFNLGRASEISRDELRFSKFIHRMQVQFTGMFDQLLEKQLRLKKILTEREWHQIADNIRYEWQQDSYFEELKGQEIWTSRMNLLTQMDLFKNVYFSQPWLWKNILKFTDDEIATMKEEFEEQVQIGPDGEAIKPGGKFGQDEDEESDEDDAFGKDATGGERFDDEADKVLKDTKNDEDGEDNEKKDKKKNPFG